MLEHHLQRNIVSRLAFSESSRFSELKPEAIENKLFDYHLKKVIAERLVEKLENGEYALTAEGRRLGRRILDKQLAAADRAESVLFLAVQRMADEAWLLYRRKTHPLRGLVGFMHALPIAKETTDRTAARALTEKTGLTGSFNALGDGYFRVFDGDTLESFTHFTLLVCKDAAGELHEQDEFAEYFWQTEPDFSAADMLPNMGILAQKLQEGSIFYLEETL